MRLLLQRYNLSSNISYRKKKLQYLFEVYHLIIFSCKYCVYVKFQMSPKKNLNRNWIINWKIKFKCFELQK